jgi:hypothetical protein
VLSHLEKVQQLSVEVQASIAKHVERYIEIARAAKSESVLEMLAGTATQEQAKAIGRGMMDPRWAAPAIALGMVLRHHEPVQGLPRPIARGSYHRSNRGVHIEPRWQVIGMNRGVRYSR